MSTQQHDPYWNAGAADIQQLNASGPDQRQSIEPQPSVLNILGRPFVTSEARPGGVQLKREIGLTTKHALCHISMHSVA